ncbi:MAG: SagB/ThcOx family dehydrogenase [Candidatus Omnitrophota bacterium]
MRINKIVYILIIFLLILFPNYLIMAELETLSLPQIQIDGKISLEKTLQSRRSQRSFQDKDLTQNQLSQILWAAGGITEKNTGGNLRTAPSAGALYPIEIYVISKNGVYHYLPLTQKIEILQKQDLRRALSNAALGQSSVKEAAVNIVLCVVYSRITGKYGQRGIRYSYIEAGHIGQNIHLQAVALGLGSVSIGAFEDKEVKNILNLPVDHEPVYIIPVGFKK